MSFFIVIHKKIPTKSVLKKNISTKIYKKILILIFY